MLSYPTAHRRDSDGHTSGPGRAISTRGKISALFERTSDEAIFRFYLALSTSDQVGDKVRKSAEH
jgi:hypothetical protein